MPLKPGATLGTYEILAPLGAGGMGEVYRARDTRLKREVALKVLPDAFAADPDRVARLQREAELLATLSHPNIAAVYGIEEADGVRAIVMELVEGETLADRMATGFALDDALAIARQIAAALEAAHDKGVVHRDLKPANVKVTAEGTVKVLDFGLAKLSDATPPSSLSMSPTLSMHATHAGVILGTAAYMSPEQARGKPVDRRTDIWSFGCVVYEMLAGRKAFAADGETVSDAIAAVLKGDPDWNALPAETPAYVRTLLRRCLQKDPQKRLPHIGSARLEIEDPPADAMAFATVPAAPSAVPGVRRRLPWIAAAVSMALAVALGIALWRRPAPPDPGALRFTIAAPDGWTIGHNSGTRGTAPPSPHFALSPDGRRLAYVMFATGKPPQLWVRRLDSLTGQSLAGTDDASFPFWSPDGQFIAFFAAGKLKKIDAAGGSVQTICDAPAGEGGTWNQEGVIVFAPSGSVDSALLRVSAAGGAATPATVLDSAAQETGHRWPQFLPDGRRFLHLRGRGTATELHIGSLDDVAGHTLVLQDALRAQYADRHLLFVRNGVLMGQAFDVEAARLTGEPVPVAEDVASNTGNRRTGFEAAGGVLAYRTGASNLAIQISRVDRTGKRLELVGGVAAYRAMRLSPDGATLAVRISDSAQLGDWWMLDLKRSGVPSRVTVGGLATGSAFWSPDGSRFAFVSGAPHVLYQKTIASTIDPEPLLADQRDKFDGDWSPDGQFILITERGGDPGDLMLLPTTKGATPRPFLQTNFIESQPRFSPDGRWVAYRSDEGGTLDIYLRAFPSGERKVRVSSAGAWSPVWRRDGRELFFFNSNSDLMAADIRPGATLEVGTPHALFNVLGGQFFFDVMPDGQQFLVPSAAGAATRPEDRPITVVANWPSLLKK